MEAIFKAIGIGIIMLLILLLLTYIILAIPNGTVSTSKWNGFSQVTFGILGIIEMIVCIILGCFIAEHFNEE